MSAPKRLPRCTDLDLAPFHSTVFVAPFTVLIPPNDQYKLSQMLIPIDDYNMMFYWMAWHETKGIEQESWRKFCTAQMEIDLDTDYRKVRNLDNSFLQDRQAMKLASFESIVPKTTDWRQLAVGEEERKLTEKAPGLTGRLTAIKEAHRRYDR